jgi:DNA-binding CsgD family transcriptional regulator
MINCIYIIEKSEIIRQGLISILSASNLAKNIHGYSSFDNLIISHSQGCKQIIICNPLLLKEDIAKTKKYYNINEQSRFIALIYTYLNKELLNNFDEIIYIDDSIESIKPKLEKCLENATNSHEHPLSKREIEILKELISGKTNKEVASSLCLSVHTVVTHRKNIMEKTNIKSLSGVAVYAIVNNIMDIQDIK